MEWFIKLNYEKRHIDFLFLSVFTEHTHTHTHKVLHSFLKSKTCSYGILGITGMCVF